MTVVALPTWPNTQNRYAGVGAGGDQSPSTHASSRSCGGAVEVDLASWAGRVVFAVGNGLSE
jgi:hypothetical protein